MADEKTPAQLIDERIEELGDWRGELLAEIRAAIKEAEPEVEIQVKGDRFPVHARIATAAEKPEMWAKMAAVWPDYDDYQERTEREIPVVVLERRSA